MTGGTGLVTLLRLLQAPHKIAGSGRIPLPGAPSATTAATPALVPRTRTVATQHRLVRAAGQYQSDGYSRDWYQKNPGRQHDLNFRAGQSRPGRLRASM